MPYTVGLFVGEITISFISFPLFSKSYNDLQYHFCCFYYIIHLEMSLSKSYTTFVQCYNIIHYVCTNALYHPCCTPWCTPHQHEREVSHCHEVFHFHCVFFAIKPTSCNWQMLRILSVLTRVMFSARDVWIFNASSLEVQLCVS